MTRTKLLSSPCTRWSLLALCTISSCGADPALDEARAALRAFETGVRSGDRDALRRAVTSRSREFVANLPVRPDAETLEIREARREYGRIFFDVADSSRDAPVAEGTFVIAKEDGTWLVDLIETAAQSARDVVSDGPVTPQFVPTEVPRAELEQAIRQHEAEAREASIQRE
ncbi:MAG: hypothetical protein H6832_10450 [Planctomycetes bacterium]|nr:hypothetical protein [Planctomycetota bacterium]